MALSANQAALLQACLDHLKNQQLGIAADNGIVFSTITAQFPEDSPGVDPTHVIFIWDDDQNVYRVQIPDAYYPPA